MRTGVDQVVPSFVEKAYELLRQGINLLVVDLFPPSPRDPQGVHKAIWDEIREEPFELPKGKPLVLAAYVAGDLDAGIETTAYVEPVGVGDRLPDMPTYLERDAHVPVPLENTCTAAGALSMVTSLISNPVILLISCRNGSEASLNNCWWNSCN